MAGFLAPLGVSLASRAIGGLFGGGGRKRRRSEYDPSQTQIDRYTRQGEESLGRLTTAMTENAMPAFNQQLQGIRETAQRRGVALGELGTSYEGDLASAFQRNLANAIAGQARGTYETALDRYYGGLDRETAERNARRQSRSSMWGSLLGAAGTALGGWLGRKD